MAKEAANPQDQSMEEILQSIKRIIAEENQDEPETSATSKAAAKPQQAANGNAGGSDVLELTDAVDEEDDPMEAMIEELEPVIPQPVISPANASTTRTESILEAVDKSPAREAHKDVLDDIDSLLSSEAAKASSSALKALQSTPKAPAPVPQSVNPGMPFRSGNTVEDLAMEALRPMLKEWLDTNLPGIVERLVEREVKKLSNM